MTYDQLMRAIHSALAAELRPHGGEAQLAQSFDTAAEYLKHAPARWRVVVFWTGFGDHEAAREGMTNHQVTALVQARKSMAFAATPHTRPEPMSGIMSFAERIALVSAIFRAFRLPDGTGADPAGFALTGSDWIDAGAEHDAHALQFALAAAHPPFPAHIALDFPHLANNP